MAAEQGRNAIAAFPESWLGSSERDRSCVAAFSRALTSAATRFAIRRFEKSMVEGGLSAGRLPRKKSGEAVQSVQYFRTTTSWMSSIVNMTRLPRRCSRVDAFSARALRGRSRSISVARNCGASSIRPGNT